MLSDSVRWNQLLRGGKSYLFIIFIGCVCCLITHWQIYMWLQKRLWVSVEKRSITNLTAPWGSREYKEETKSTCPFPLQLWWEFKIGKLSFLPPRCVCVDIGKETWKLWFFPIQSIPLRSLTCLILLETHSQSDVQSVDWKTGSIFWPSRWLSPSRGGIVSWRTKGKMY